MNCEILRIKFHFFPPLPVQLKHVSVHHSFSSWTRKQTSLPLPMLLPILELSSSCATSSCHPCFWESRIHLSPLRTSSVPSSSVVSGTLFNDFSLLPVKVTKQLSEELQKRTERQTLPKRRNESIRMVSFVQEKYVAFHFIILTQSHCWVTEELKFFPTEWKYEAMSQTQDPWLKYWFKLYIHCLLKYLC